MSKEAVILLHGLGRTRFSLIKLAFSLRNDYQIVNLGYPSRRYCVETLAELAIKPALEKCQSARKVHFVTHSMGGILVREYLRQHTITNIGHTVMLGPPNSGSELVDFFMNKPVLNTLFQRINGPAGTQLGTDDDSKPNQLGAAEFSLGVIAGNRSKNPVWSRLMPDQHDGKVSVESSKLSGMTDHLVLDVDHTFMMQNSTVISHVKHFLKHGAFASLTQTR